MSVDVAYPIFRTDDPASALRVARQLLNPVLGVLFPEPSVGQRSPGVQYVLDRAEFDVH
ncbi:hypothetical protein [Streptomyces sp. NBC_01643]|uniref:hypothetical protein n=1 Tax=Streptomyces sp. NBC_01643 TaxID=2975906 RepID=UPI00386328D5|nr:hypothetical protein OHB03_14085 [Streptomyces sp. NBC_01643]